MVELMVERTLLFEADLKRDFRPFQVEEGNFTCELETKDGETCLVCPVGYAHRHMLQRRQRRIHYVSEDQNRLCMTVDDRGPATADGQFVMPCGGAVEMAEAWDQIEALKERQRALAERQAWVKPIRDAAWLKALGDMQEQEALAFRRASVVGPGLTVQRAG